MPVFIHTAQIDIHRLRKTGKEPGCNAVCDNYDLISFQIEHRQQHLGFVAGHDALVNVVPVVRIKPLVNASAQAHAIAAALDIHADPYHEHTLQRFMERAGWLGRHLCADFRDFQQFLFALRILAGFCHLRSQNGIPHGILHHRVQGDQAGLQILHLLKIVRIFHVNFGKLLLHLLADSGKADLQ